MAGTEEYGKALLATHIDPAWPGPDGFQDVVERYIKEEDYDDLVYISDPGCFTGNYEEQADQVLRSRTGDIDPFDADRLLDRYDSFTHIGAYWGACHYATFESLVRQIDGRDEEYRIDIPLDGVSDVDDLVVDAVKDRYGPVAGLSFDELEDGLHAVGVGYLRYTRTVDDVFDAGEADMVFDPVPVPTLSWLFNAEEG